MSYEMMRFGWQKLLVNQVPQKGGRKGAPVIQGPPPRDWSPEWNRVTASGQAALSNLNEISSIFTTTGTTSQFVARQNEINAKIAAATNQIDQALALNSTIPASWFGDRLSDRNAVIANLQQTRSNLNRFIGNRTPTQLDLISDEIDRQTLLLATQNRVLKGPIDPLPIDGSYPSGSWQNAMWSRGYALHEISWVEEEMSRDPAIIAAANDYELYKKLIEDKIQDGIVGGKIPPAERREILQINPVQNIIPETLTATNAFLRTPTGTVGGVGTYVLGQPVQPSRQVVVFGEDGKTYGSPGQVPLGIRWSFSPWTEQAVNQEIALPQPPRGIVPGSKAYQTWLRRQVRKPVIRSPGRPAIIYCDKPGWNTPPNIDLPKPNLPIGERNSLPRCGTGIVTGGNWEAVLIGEGCPVSHLDTIRRFFTVSRLKPNANRVEIARQMCAKLKNQDALLPDVRLVNPVKIGLVQGSEFSVLDAEGVEVANIPGVLQTPLSPRTIAAQNLAARRQASRVRRGAFR